MNCFIRKTPLPVRLLAAVLPWLLSGCGAKDAAQAVTGIKTQVAARVNGTELTLSQLNLVLTDSRIDAGNPGATRLALDKLINQELLVQQALADKLDRDPDVMLRIEQARRQVLADAYTEKHVYDARSVPEAQLRAYYDAHPALFKERRVYNITAFATDQPTLNAAVRAELPQTHTEAALKDLLARYGVGYTVEYLQEGADALPLELESSLAAAQSGAVLQTTHGSNSKVALFLVTAATSNPASFTQASDTIATYLSTQAHEKELSSWLTSSKKGARIEYVGNIGQLATASDTAAAEQGLKNLN
ncbi:MAG: EpsD family peptidyl-prolyl cis-trans isomerase [Steroidobacteraceae bacterium]